MISVTPRARSREDRAGDPLDGLVNLFDLGIVLSVAFLLAALSSLHLGGAITKQRPARRPPSSRSWSSPGQTVAPLPKPGARTIGRGTQAGVVYRLANGQLVYVQNAPTQRAREWATSGIRRAQAFPLIFDGKSGIADLLWVTLRVAVISTSVALVIGLPLGLALGLGRFRGRRTLQLLANASLALPSVVVGVAVLMLLLPQAQFGSLRWRVHDQGRSTSLRRSWRCPSSSRSRPPRSRAFRPA